MWALFAKHRVRVVGFEISGPVLKAANVGLVFGKGIDSSNGCDEDYQREHPPRAAWSSQHSKRNPDAAGTCQKKQLVMTSSGLDQVSGNVPSISTLGNS
jgi:hypothetical protein